MTRFLRSTTWIGLLGLLLVTVTSVAAQETQEDKAQDESLWESIKDTGQELLEGAEDVVDEAGEALSHARRQAADRASTTLREARKKYFPIIEEAGYQVAEIRLTAGLAPGVSLKVIRVEKIGQERRQALLEKYRDDRGAHGVLEAIFLADGIHAEGLEVRELIVTLGLHPRATVIFMPS